MAGRPITKAKARASAIIELAKERGETPPDWETTFQAELDKLLVHQKAASARTISAPAPSLVPIEPIERPRIEPPSLSDLLGDDPFGLGELSSVVVHTAQVEPPAPVVTANVLRLNAVGIGPIAEQAAGGCALREIAAKLNVSVISLSRWLRQNPDRQAEFAEAERIGAQYWDDAAQRILESATDGTTLGRAKELASHYRWRAKAMDGARYADKQSVDLQGQVRLSADQIEARLLTLVGTLPMKRIVSEQ